jgi:hypothetical protein
MLPNLNKNVEEAKALAAQAEELNRKADAVVDPIANKIIASRYTVVIIILAMVFAFAAGFAAAQTWC